MKKIIKYILFATTIACSFSTHSKVNNDLKVQANVIGNCEISANDVHFSLTGQEGFIHSQYVGTEGRTETVWDNIQNLTIDVRCYKNAQFTLKTNTKSYNDVGWVELFHTTSKEPNKVFLVLFPLKETSENITKTSGRFILRETESIGFQVKDNNPAQIFFSAEIDHNLGEEFGFRPGTYHRELELVLSF